MRHGARRRWKYDSSGLRQSLLIQSRRLASHMDVNMISIRRLSFARRARILPALLGLTLVFGCSTGPLADYYGLNPFNRQGPEEEEYGPAPAVRRQQVRATARKARSMPPAEQIRVAADLALQLQNEVDPFVRGDIVRALGNFNTQSAHEALRMAMDDRKATVRIAACDAWRTMGGPDAIAALSKTLGSDTDNDVRMAAARALGAFQDPAAARGLSVALDDGDPALQYRAMESLRTVSGENHGYDVVAWRDYVDRTSPAGRNDNVRDDLREQQREGPTLADQQRDRF